MAHIIVVGNEKGGAGKSTVSMHVAAALARLGHKVSTLDLDLRQKTLGTYIANRTRFLEKSGLALPGPRFRELPDIDQPAPSIRERQRREDLTAPEREFPTGESAVIGRETASEIADQAQEPSLEQPATAFGTGAGSRGIRDLFLAGDERAADDVAGAGTEPGSGLGTFDTATVTTEPDVPTDVGTDGETDLVGGGTGTGTQTDTATAATGETVVEPALLGETTVPAQETAEPDAQFAEPELTAFETQVAEPTVPEVSTGPGEASRDIRDFRLPGDDDNDDPDAPGLGLRADQLDSGILSGDEALRNFLGR